MQGEASPPQADREPSGFGVNCGVFAIRGLDDYRAAAITALGLHALQHRGHEGCGIAAIVEDDAGARMQVERKAGFVADHFLDERFAKAWTSRSAVGHLRYSTSGKKFDVGNLQPLPAKMRWGDVAVAHNGNLTNAFTIRDRLNAEGRLFQSSTDTEVILHLMASSRRDSSVDRLLDALHQIEGGYALALLSATQLIAARDPDGIRPLIYGRLGDAVVFASETSAIEFVGGEPIRDVEPGEVMIATDGGLTSIRAFPPRAPRARTCAFEYIYFARPDSVIDGVAVYPARKRMGRILAEEHPAEVDMVVPVLESGISAALGCAEAMGKPFEIGLVKSLFAKRSFIQPSQELRQLGVTMKHKANASILEGARVMLVDDSIVRGTTSQEIVQMVFAAGASEVHFRSASPRISYPDFYGIDMAARGELLAARIPSVAAMTAYLGATSLGFLSIDGLYRAILGEARDPERPQLTDHYFTGDYPTRLQDLENGFVAGWDDRLRPAAE